METSSLCTPIGAFLLWVTITGPSLPVDAVRDYYIRREASNF